MSHCLGWEKNSQVSININSGIKLNPPGASDNFAEPSVGLSGSIYFSEPKRFSRPLAVSGMEVKDVVMIFLSI